MSDRPQAGSRRRVRTPQEREARSSAILDAALDVFLENGFAGARLDDVAARAGVAKGTIYLYAESKQALFESLIRSGIAAPIAALEARVLALDLPAEATLRTLFSWLRTEVLGTRRRDVARLVLTEAHRFPELAEIYHREVVDRGLRFIRTVAARAVERGEFRSDQIVRFPQLVIAPALVALIWSNLFAHLEPLDTEGLFDAHLELLMRALKGGEA